MNTTSSTDKKAAARETIIRQGLLPLFYNEEERVSIAVLQALYEAGIRTVEYTNRGTAALQNFKALRRICEAELKDMQLGIGTIKTGDEAKIFVEAGADYLVSPGVVKEAAKVAEKANLLYIPGCMTPTEMIKAERLGATLVKVFPGDLLGPGFIRGVRPLFPNLSFMVTGGVEPEESNLRGWFDAGVSAVGMGSKLISNEVLKSENYSKITVLANESLQLIQSTKK